MHATPSLHHVLGAVSGADVVKRASAAVVGAAVGDASALGLHWEYDTKKLTTTAASLGGNLEFCAPSTPYHASRKAGDASFYGVSLQAMLRSIRDAGGWNAGQFSTAYFSGETFVFIFVRLVSRPDEPFIFFELFRVWSRRLLRRVC